MDRLFSVTYRAMRRSWKIVAILFFLGLIIPTAYSLRLSGLEPSPLQNYASLGTILASQNSGQKSFYNQLFSEETLTVSKESDSVLPGTLRTVMLQAMGIRHNNPFTLVKITFDPSVKHIRVNKGNLPPVTGGLISLDCADHVTLDGSTLDTRYLGEGETPAGLILQSSGNTVKGCQIVGFSGNGLVLSGNRNQIRENKIGSEGKAEETLTNAGSGIFFSENASENIIESNQIAGNKLDGITFSPYTGPGNRVVGNIFMENGRKGIGSTENLNRSVKPALKPIVKEGDSYIISGTLADVSDVEIFMAGPNGREGKMTIVPLFTQSRGDFSISVKSKGFFPGETKIVGLATSPGRNTSEFSDPVVIPSAEARTFEASASPTAAPPALTNDVEKESATNQPAVSAGDEGTSDNNSIKPLNERASSALSVGTSPSSLSSPQGIFSSTPSSNSSASTPPPVSPTTPTVDPFLNSTTLPPTDIPQISAPPSVKKSGVKSGESDSMRVESVTDVVGAP